MKKRMIFQKLKTLLNNNKIGLILAILLSLFIVSNCTSDTTPRTSGRTTASPKDDDDDTKTKLDCELPASSGETTCGKDKDCKLICSKSGGSSTPKGLGIPSGKTSRDLCYAMGKEDVEKLLEITKILYQVNKEALVALGDDEEKMSLLCAGVSKLDYGILEDRINKYSNSSSKVRKILGWVAETPYMLDVFENAKKGKGVDMFRKLLSKAGGGSTVDALNILKGLSVKVDTESTRGETGAYFMRWAVNNNQDIAEWVHKHIIADEDKGLCKKEHWPVSPLDPSGEGGYAEDACLLAVYCKIAPDNNAEDNDFREKIAEVLRNSSGVSDLITEFSNPSYGGLGLSETDGENWSRKACCKLSQVWNNNKKLSSMSGYFDLGLGNRGVRAEPAYGAKSNGTCPD